MATSGGGFAASGLLQGFAQAYNQAYQHKTQQELDQRHQFAQFLISAMPNMRPEAQQDASNRLLQMYSTPPGKKVDKKIYDASTIGQQAYQNGPGQAQQQMNANVGSAQNAPLPTGQAPGIQGPPQNQAPAPSIPPPPQYSMFLSPQEHLQQQEAAAAGLTGATETAKHQAYTQAFGALQNKFIAQGMSPQEAAVEARLNMGGGINMGAMMTPHVTGHNISGAEAIASNPNIKTIGGEAPDPKAFYNVTQTGMGTSLVPAGLGAQVALSNINGTAFKSFMQQKMSEGMSREDANTLWNTTQSTQQGFKSEPQPDGSIKMVPVTTTTTHVKGGGIPTPPSGGAAGPSSGTPGRTVGGKLPPDVAKSQSDYLNSIERYNVMSSALPKALAGDQQAMINLLYNHIGMTVGLQKGARITRDIISEAQTSAPWMATLLSRIGVGNGFTMTPDALRGVVIPPDTMHNMIGLAEDRVTEDYNRFNSTKAAYASGALQTPEQVKAGGQARQKGLTPPPSSGGVAIPTGAQTATGPGGHKIFVQGGKWVDSVTGKPIQ